MQQSIRKMRKDRVKERIVIRHEIANYMLLQCRKNKRYAYCRCETQGCEAKCKSVARAKLEAGFEEITRRLAPSHDLIEVAEMMFQDVSALKEQTMIKKRAAW